MDLHGKWGNFGGKEIRKNAIFYKSEINYQKLCT